MTYDSPGSRLGSHFHGPTDLSSISKLSIMLWQSPVYLYLWRASSSEFSPGPPNWRSARALPPLSWVLPFWGEHLNAHVGLDGQGSCRELSFTTNASRRRTRNNWTCARPSQWAIEDTLRTIKTRVVGSVTMGG